MTGFANGSTRTTTEPNVLTVNRGLTVESSKFSRTFTSFDLGEMLKPLASDENFCARLAPSLSHLLSRYDLSNDMTFVAAQVLSDVADNLSDSYDLPRPHCPTCLVANEIFSLKCEINALLLLLASIRESNLEPSANAELLLQRLEGCLFFFSSVQNHVDSLDLQLQGEEG
jgi:hypothetical protein